MCGDSGHWEKVNENRLAYKIPTSAGQFGSPIYGKDADNAYYVIGIHTKRDLNLNSGLLMNQRIR